MKLNNKIIALLLVFIAILSISAVSAAEITDNGGSGESSSNIAPANEGAVQASPTTHEIPANANMTQIANIIKNTNASDIISFAPGAVYNLGNISKESIPITHTLIIQGNNATIKANFDLIIDSKTGKPTWSSTPIFLIQGEDESVAGTQVYNLNFDFTSDILWSGQALHFENGKDYLIENCTFHNGGSGIYIKRAAGNVTIKNNYFYADDGSTNQSTIKKDFGKQETGSKAINLMGGSGITIIGNTMDGDYLDAVSIASGASNVKMYNNTANGVWYGVFYGGGITNITMNENTFNKSKAFALGIVKAAGNSDIYNNTFITDAGETTIYVEEGNTAHGYPSNIETIRIYENEFQGENSTAVAIKSKGGFITPKGEFIVKNNIYDNNVLVYSFNDNNEYILFGDSLLVEEKRVDIEGNESVKELFINFLDDDKYKQVKEALFNSKRYTYIIFNEESSEFETGDSIEIILIGDDNVALPNQNFEINIASSNGTVEKIDATTDAYGIYKLPVVYAAGKYNISASFNGNEFNYVIYEKAVNKTNFEVVTAPAVISGKNATVSTKSGERYEIMLKDADNKALAGKEVHFTVNGRTYTRGTDENGIAGLNINLEMGEFPITVDYTDASGKVYNETFILTAVQSKSDILCDSVTFKGKGNKYTAQLVDQLGNPLADKAVAFHINGVKYYRLTDKDGKFSIGINLEPGIYNMFMSFDGTGQYLKCNGGSQVTVE